MNRPNSEARDAFLLALFFAGYGLLVWMVRRNAGTIARVSDALDPNRLQFARLRRAEMIAEENTDGD